MARGLGVDPARGLDAGERARRRAAHGPNLLRRIEPRPAWSILLEQFRSLVVLLLAAAAVTAFAFREAAEGVAVVIVLAINAAIGFLTEIRAVRSMESLRRLGAASSRVLEGGVARTVPAEDLVPGDVVLVEGGDAVDADLRIVEASGLQASEAALTGESAPVDKRADPVAGDTPLAERASMLYKGTAVTRGAGAGIVVANGMETELGRISALVETAGRESTPLQRRLHRLGRGLVWATLGCAALVALAGVVTGRGVYLSIQTAIALAVAAVPEGLPIVATIALARGMWRMARRRALIERLSAVETLGSTTLILTDKTGTLTENRMTVVRLALPGGDVELEAGGAAPPPEAGPLLRAAVLCNDAALPTGGGEPAGDPTEVALLAAGARAGLRREALVTERPEVREEAFDPERHRMATVHREDGGYLVAVKGAPAAILDLAGSAVDGDGSRPLDEAARRRWLERNEAMARAGLRVLAVAEKRVDRPDADPWSGLALLGLVGLLDPPRSDVRSAIEACRRAGVRVVMATGDQAATARTVAEAVGLEPDRVIARATPEDKLALLARYQSRGEVVAMIGDGVNDAPALRRADIGVAMGRRGTAVAREAAAMVLADDRLSTIVAAIEQGRVIFDNIRKFVLYLLSCNLSEVLVVGLAAAVGAPLPILPLQILFLNLVTDVFPALALGVGEGGADVLSRPPRDPKEPVLRDREWLAILGYGTLITVATLAGLALGLEWTGRDDPRAVTISFLVLAFSQLGHVFNMAERDSGVVVNEVTRNPWVWLAIALCAGLLVAAVHWPILTGVLRTAPPGPRGWLLVAGLSAVPLAVGRLVRLARGRRAPA